jgi:hypothetical protein
MATVHVRHDREAVVRQRKCLVAVQAVSPVQARVDNGPAQAVHRQWQRVAQVIDQAILPLDLDRHAALHLERATRPGIKRPLITIAPDRRGQGRHPIRANQAGELHALPDCDLGFPETAHA